jgi:hypothetical protein
MLCRSVLVSAPSLIIPEYHGRHTDPAVGGQEVFGA